MAVDQSQRIGFLLYRIGRAIATEYRREMEAFGFRPEVAGMLHALHDRGSTHTRELSRTIGVNRQTIVNEANVLAERGLITRSTSLQTRAWLSSRLRIVGDANSHAWTENRSASMNASMRYSRQRNWRLCVAISRGSLLRTPSAGSRYSLPMPLRGRLRGSPHRTDAAVDLHLGHALCRARGTC